MEHVFSKRVNGAFYTFYRAPLFGEVAYNVSLLQEGRTTVFVLRKKGEGWKIAQGAQLPPFVLEAEAAFSALILENEGA